jgi:hypothetical protein
MHRERIIIGTSLMGSEDEGRIVVCEEEEVRKETSEQAWLSSIGVNEH